MEENNISIIFDENNLQALIYLDDKVIGECDYELQDGKWYIMHTIVKPEHNGHGYAKMLVNKVVEEARKRNIKIVPICSYALKVLSNPEYKDVL